MCSLLLTGSQVGLGAIVPAPSAFPCPPFLPGSVHGPAGSAGFERRNRAQVPRSSLSLPLGRPILLSFSKEPACPGEGCLFSSWSEGGSTRTHRHSHGLELVMYETRLGLTPDNSFACFSTGSRTRVGRVGCVGSDPHQNPNTHKQVDVSRDLRTVLQRKCIRQGGPAQARGHSPISRWLMTKASSSFMLRVCVRVASALLHISSLQDVGWGGRYQLRDHHTARGGSCRVLLAAKTAGCNTTYEQEGEPQCLVTRSAISTWTD